MKKRSPFIAALIFVAITLVTGGLCDWLVIRPIGQRLCIIRPESTRKLPIPLNAENIRFGKFNYDLYERFEGKHIEFDTADSPTAVYDFYKQALIREGWDEDIQMTISDRLGAKLLWQCAFESTGTYAVLWFSAETIDSDSTTVILDFQYQP